MREYNHKEIEPKWQKEWAKAGIYKTALPAVRHGDDSAKEKCYVLDMFPYPSGEGLHVGHPKGYIGTDVYSRYKKMKGFSVLHPMGWDAFGLPAENYALKHKIHPRVAVEKNIARFKDQLGKIGFTYDWSREINTTDPAFYKWTQWIFLQLFKKGLAYESHEPINWCPSCKTGLALEDLEGGKCERCGSEVEKKPLRQWVLKIREYADRLLSDLDALNWPESIKESQRNWIGRSEGAKFEFPLSGIPGQKDGTHKVKVFTTRPDTLFGATFVAVSADLAKSWLEVGWQASGEVKDFIEKTRKEEMRRALNETPEKDGIFAGIYAENPASKEKIPVWIVNYVLSGYGTGAIMAVPAHDERDFQFAKKFNLPVRQVIWKKNAPVKSYLMGGKDIPDDDLKKLDIEIIEEKSDGDRLLIIPQKALRLYEKLISDKLAVGFWNEYVGEKTIFLFKHKDGHVERIELLPETERHIDELAAQFMDETWKKTSVWKWLAENKFYTDAIIHADAGIIINSGEFGGMPSEEAKWKITEKFGERRVDYKLRDWVFSRQRYWGEPIPLIFCENCKKSVETSKSYKLKAKSSQFSAGELLNPGWIAVPEEDLPVKLPEVESYVPTGTGESPLAGIPEWVNTKCPKCDGEGKRETNTMPQWAGSSWYYIAYIVKESKSYNLKAKSSLKKWLPVDLYVGGADHATRHLIYARFWHKALFDLGFVADPEPFLRLKNQGNIQGEDGRKMSKRWGNVVNPDDIVERFGADTLRVYEMFMGPFEDAIAWSADSIVGPRRFLEKVWRLQEKVTRDKRPARTTEVVQSGGQETGKKIERLLHKTIKKVSEDIEAFRFNTAVSALMIFVNELEKEKEIPHTVYGALLTLLSPFAPHIAEELWHEVGERGYIYEAAWPAYDAKKAEDEEATIVVQVNGRVRGSFVAALGTPEEEIKRQAQALPAIEKWVSGAEVVRVLSVPGKLVNIVTKK